MERNAANDNVALNDSYDWLSVLRPLSSGERTIKLAFQLEDLADEVEKISTQYESYPDNYASYRGKKLFPDADNRPDFLTAEYNYDLVRTTLARGYIALRHIELLGDMSVYESDFANHNQNDANFTFDTAIAMKNGAKRAFSVITGEDNWHADPDIEHVETLNNISASIAALEELVMDHFKQATSTHGDRKIITPFAKSALLDEIDLNIHLYSVYAASQLQNRLRYAKGLFNAMAYEPESLPYILREDYPHPDLYMQDTISTAKAELETMLETVVSTIQKNHLSREKQEYQAPPVVFGQIRRGLPLFGFDLKA